MKKIIIMICTTLPSGMFLVPGGANLSGAQMPYVILCSSNLSGAILNGTILRDATLAGTICMDRRDEM